MGRVTVVGSTNVDLIANVPRLPRPGENVGGAAYSRTTGGKGANQAIAAARAGAEVGFISSIGEDDFGAESLAQLERAGVDTRWVHRAHEPTGVAIIMVDRDGENCIAIAPGANFELKPRHIEAAKAMIERSDVVMTQLEVPMETVEYTARLARRLGRRFLLNPAPVPEAALSKALLSRTDVIVLNETESERLTGVPVFGGMELPYVARQFHAYGITTVVITLGPKGCYASGPDFEGLVPAFSVTAIDSTGAGDVFSGYLAAALAEGQHLADAVRLAAAAGAVSVTRLGAQPSIPDIAEVTDLVMSRVF